MNRCLHITINETPGAAPGSVQAKTPDSGSTDPGGNIAMPPPDGRQVYPPGTDPSAGAYGGGHARAGATEAGSRNSS